MANRRRPVSEINVVPYIDVMLVLLVVFMVTAPLLTQGVELNLPKKPSDPLPNDQDDPLIVSVRGDGSIFMNVGMENVEDLGNRVNLFSLREQARKIIELRPSVPVFIRADVELSYGAFIDVMSALQESGAQTVGLITDPPEGLDRE
ncbi:MAG: protein TolR [Pseudomonadales bacterium]|nr:protein TolR [Pseudomonadales bacterium]